MSQAFGKFFLEVGIGTNRKLRRLPVVQRWAFVSGVLALAAQSPMRGALLISDGVHVTAEDVAEEATVSVRAARATLVSLRELGMLERDRSGVEWVHDWDKFNPDPKPSDSPEATRERKRAQREREKQARGHANVTRDTAQCHAPKEEVEEELPPLAPPRGGRQRAKHLYEEELDAFTGRHFPDTKAWEVARWRDRLVQRGISPTAAAIRACIDNEKAAA